MKNMYFSMRACVALSVLMVATAMFAHAVPANTARDTLSSVPFDRNALVGEVSAVLKIHAAADVIVTLVQPDPPSQSKNLNKAQYRAAMRAANHAASEKVLAVLEATEFTEQYRFDNFAGFSGAVTEKGFKKLLAHPSVLFIEPVRYLEAHLAQGIPLMNATTVRTSYNGSGMAIAVCDTGIDYTHPRLGNGSFPNAKVLGGYDFGDSDANPAPDPSQAHGTCCAGITAGDLGTVGDYIGGVAYNAKLYALKISYGTSGSATTAAMVGAWDWCVTHQNDNPTYPIMVISTSFGGGRYYSAATGDSASPSMTTAAGNAVAAGITVLASSGNDGYCDSMGWPAAISSVISVGAVYDASFGNYYPCVNENSCAPKTSTTGCSTGWYATDATTPDRVTSYSNAASFLTLLAPSNRAYTTDIVGSSGYASGDYYLSFGGTSAACPYAAGAVACLQSAAQTLLGRYLTVAEVRSILTSTGVNITDPKVAITKPRVNLDAAVDFLSTMSLSSFGWSSVSSPQEVDSPFAVTVTALDWLDQPDTDFNGTVNLSGLIPGGTSEVTIGTGTGTWVYPLSTSYHDARTQVIYLAGELGSAKEFESLSLYVSTIPGQATNSLTIRMKHTTLSAFASATWEGSGWTTVYRADKRISTTGWVTFPFSTPFLYDGMNNLMIDFSFNNASYTSNGLCRYSTPGGNRSVYYRTNSGYGDPLTWSGTTPTASLGANVPNIKLSGVTYTPVSITPTMSGSFTNGVWNGAITVLETAEGMLLRADDGNGHRGDSNLFDVIPLTPMVTTWPTASAITYGQSLAASTLSGGAASVPGSFAFTTPGLTPNAGTAGQSVTFTPTDTSKYATVEGTVSVTVNKATPVVTVWPTASAITYGQSLAASTLTGGTASVPGSFAFTTPGLMPNAGTAGQSVTFIPTDTGNYNTVVGTVSVTVNKATPTVTTWPTASAITYGQSLAASILTGGTASVPGSFTFTTPALIPGVGTADQSVTFTPADTGNYNTVEGPVSVTVNPITHTLTYLAGANGSIFGVTPQTVNDGTDGSEVEALPNTGYHFVSWSDGSTENPRVDENVTADINVTASFAGNTYTATFDAQGGDTPAPESKEVIYDAPYGPLAITARTGYDFNGWFTVPDAGSLITESTIVSIASSHMLYAQWAANTYTVTFDANGGNTPVPETKSVTYDTAYSTLATTSRTGYTFNGWYTASAGGDLVTDATIVSTAFDHTLYAQWTANTYTVTFNANGGDTPVPETKSVTYDADYGALSTTSRMGYTFNGWYTAPAGGDLVTEAAIVTTAADHALYAQWTADSYTVTFDANGGDTPAPENKTVTYDAAYGTLATTLRTGYTFSGWYSAPTGGDLVTDATIVDTAGDHTLYAQWAANTYTVTFDAQGGDTPVPENRIVTFNAAYGILATTSRTGYTFNGWYTAPAGGDLVIDATIVSATDDHMLYAQWTANTYTATFAAQGGDMPVPAFKEVIYDAPYGPLATTSRSGYSFEGWYTAASAGSLVTEATIVSTASSHSLYAQWMANTYTVTFDAQGGETPVPASKGVTYDSAYGELATTTRTCYTFIGWYTAPSGGELVLDTTIVSTANNHTLYAQWLVDTTAPVITECAADPGLLSLGADCTVAVPDLTVGVVATDNCSGVTVTQVPASGTPVGEDTLVTLTATDAVGNTADCAVTLTVADTTAPVITACASDPGPLSLGADCTAALPDLRGDVVATDNCGGVTVTQVPASGTSVGEDTLVTLTVTDAVGNTADCVVTVTVADTTAPVITACASDPGPLSLGADCTVALPDLRGDVVATDNCGGVTVTQVPASGTPVGEDTLVTLAVTDAVGNTADCIVTVTVVDTTAPVITTCAADPGPLSLGVDCTVALPDLRGDVVATDNCSGVTVTQVPASGTPVGEDTLVTLTATDGSGNMADCAVTVTVVDTTAPVITECAVDPGPLSLGADCTVALPDLTDDVVVTDNCGGVIVTQSPAPDTPIGADTLVTLTATDGAGNISTCAVTVSVDECIEGEGEVPAEGEGEPIAEGEGEAPIEGETPLEGEGEAPAEGEGEFTLEYPGLNPLVVHAGDAVEIFVIPINGIEPITYQWYRITEEEVFEPLSGQTEASLVFETVFISDMGTYLCIAYDAGDQMAQSPAITLSILPGVTASGVVALVILSLVLAAGGMAKTRKHKQ